MDPNANVLQERTLRKLNNAPKKNLIDILTNHKIPFDYTSDKKILADTIIKQFTINEKTKKPKHSKTISQIFYNFITSRLFIILLLSILIGLYYKTREIKFYDSHLYNPTQTKFSKCPLFGKCSNGSCVCDLNYTIIKNYCIFNDEDKTLVSIMLEKAYSVLQKRSGSYYCQKSEIDWMSIEELEGILLKSSKLNISKFNKIYQKVLTYINNDPNILSKEINDVQVFVSIEMKIDVYCKARQYFFKNVKFNYISIAIAILLLISIILSFYKRSKKKKLIANRYTAFVINNLKRRNGIHQSTNQIIYDLDKESDNNGKYIWPLVEKKLQKTSNIQYYYDGTCSNYRYIK